MRGDAKFNLIRSAIFRRCGTGTFSPPHCCKLRCARRAAALFGVLINHSSFEIVHARLSPLESYAISGKTSSS
jgi:hypothetical protein